MSDFENIDIKCIYKAFGNDTNNDKFDTNNTYNEALQIIEEFFVDKKNQDSRNFNNSEYLNIEFSKLLKFAFNTKKYKEFHFIFLSFCDYYDLEYNMIFINLHEKLQKIVRYYATKFIGVDVFKVYIKKCNVGVQIKTLGDL